MIISKFLAAIRKVRKAISPAKTNTAQMERLFSAIEAVAMAESEQALEEVLKRYPELLELDTMKEIGRMGHSARSAGDLEDAELFGAVFMRLHTFGREIGARWNTPKIVSKVSWCINARKYLSLREKEFLNEAIVETEKFPDIQRFLKLFAEETLAPSGDRDHMPEYKSLALELITQLKEEGREEEALTIRLINHHESASAMEKIDEATLEQKEALFPAGLNICEDSIRIARMFDDHACQAFYLGVMGNCFWKTNLITTAEIYFDRALKFYRELAPKEPRSLSFLAITLMHLGNTKAQLHRYQEARTLFDESVHIFRGLADRDSTRSREELATALMSLGMVQNILGQSTHSEKSFAQALQIFRSLVAEKANVFDDRIATALSNLSIVQRKLNRLALAEDSASEALEIYRRLDRELGDRIPYFYARFIVEALNNLSSIQHSRGNTVEAEARLEEALKLSRTLVRREPSIFQRHLVITLSNLGSLQEEQEKFEEAERYLTEAIQVEESSIQPTLRFYSKELGGFFHNLANAQRGNSKLAEAERSYARALQTRRNLVQENGAVFRQDLVSTLHNLADLHLAQNNPSVAEGLFSEARDLIERMRETALTIDERNRLMQDNNHIYTGLLECYVKLNDSRKALEIAEIGKSRSLSDLLNLKAADWQPKAPTPDTVATVKKLGAQYSQALTDLQRLESYETALSDYSPDDPEQKKQWESERVRVQNERFEKHSDLERALADIGTYDKNFPPKAKQIDIETVFQISRKLDRTIVLFRTLRESTAIIFVFPNGKLHVEEVKGFGRQQLFAMFRDNWFRPYTQSKQQDSDQERWKDALAQMLNVIYKNLLIQVHRVLREKSSTNEVLFVPTQSLALLPLHAASWKDTNGKERYLCEEYTISYAPSVSVFKRCLENEKARSNTTLLVADRESLPGAAAEADYIKKLHEPTRQFPETPVEKSTLKSSIIAALQEDFSFAHFCCHGSYYQASPFDSGLEVYSDVVITLSDIINCNLHNNWLTTLSACETGMVDFTSPTDEHFGLPLGFIFAGSPSVWASLWLVDDLATSALMQRAYENLNKKEYWNNKPEALRQAQLSILQEFPHPYYWASFQHFGV